MHFAFKNGPLMLVCSPSKTRRTSVGGGELPGGASLEPSGVSPLMSERHTGEHSVGHFSSRGMPHSLGYCYQGVRSVDEEAVRENVQGPNLMRRATISSAGKIEERLVANELEGDA